MLLFGRCQDSVEISAQQSLETSLSACVLWHTYFAVGKVQFGGKLKNWQLFSITYIHTPFLFSIERVNNEVCVENDLL